VEGGHRSGKDVEEPLLFDLVWSARSPFGAVT
jgi:hypothetical protein